MLHELCPDGFDVIDRANGDNGGLVVGRGFVSETHKPEVDAIIRCNAGSAVDPDDAPWGNNPDEARAFWCLVDGPCWTIRRGCKGSCFKLATAFCSPYDGRAGAAFACGQTMAACRKIVTDEVVPSTGRTSRGPCVAREAKLQSRERRAVGESPPQFCFGFTDDKKPASRCMPTMDSCRSTRDAIVAVNAENVGECVETH